MTTGSRYLDDAISAQTQPTTAYPATAAWLGRLWALLHGGHHVAPRGQKTRELLHQTMHVDMTFPAVIAPTRRLGYRFMAAEAFWIMTGDDRAATITPYNRNIGQFSDDGVTFFGAYGPKFQGQVAHVVRALGGDRDTRQAWINIWRENPPPTKDTPCTLALGWQVRSNVLHCHAYMRSSDVWLGIPYDVFNFSVLSAYVARQLATLYCQYVRLGTLHLTAASSHLYERDVERAREVLANDDPLALGEAMPNPAVHGGFEQVCDGLRRRMLTTEQPEDVSLGTWAFWRRSDAHATG